MYNRAVRNFFLIPAAIVLSLVASVRAQQPAASPQPQVRVNYLNVCSPSAEEQRQIAGALERISAHPKFAVDFEVARGRSTLSGSDLLVQNAAPPGCRGLGFRLDSNSPGVSRVVEFRQCSVFVQHE